MCSTYPLAGKTSEHAYPTLCGGRSLDNDKQSVEVSEKQFNLNQFLSPIRTSPSNTCLTFATH